MIGIQTATMPSDRLFALYGDHQASLPETFAVLGFTNERIDDAFWSAGREKCPLQDLAGKYLAGSLPALQAAVI